MSVEKHSLQTEIEVSFADTAANMSKFADDINKMNNQFGSIGQNADKMNQAFEKLDFNITGKIDQAVKDLKKGDLILNGTKIKDYVEESISKAIMGRKIAFTDLNDNDPIPVKLGDQGKKQLQKALERMFAHMADHMEPNPEMFKGMEGVRLNARTIGNLKSKFSQALTDAIDTAVTFDALKDGELIKSLDIPITTLNKTIKEFEQEFIKHLNKPGMVKLDAKNLKPIEVGNAEFEKAIANVQAAVNGMDKEFNGLANKLNKIPNVSEKLTEFKNHSDLILKRLFSVLNSIDKLKGEEDTDKQYAQVRKSIANLHEFASTRVSGLLDELSKEIGKMPISGKDFTNTVKVLEGVQDKINAFLFGNILAAEQALEKAFNIQTEKIDGKKVKAPSIKKLQQQVIRAAEEAVKNLDMADLNIDTSKVKSMFNAWATESVAKLQSEWAAKLKPLQTDLLASNRKVIQEFVDSITSLSRLNIFADDKDKLNPLDVEIDMKAVRRQVETEMKKMAKTLVGNVTFSEAGARSLEEGVKLPKSVADSLNTSVRNLLQTQAKRLADQVSDRKGLSYNEADMEKFDKALFEQSSRLINNVVQQAHTIASTLSSGIDSKGFKTFSSEEQDKIREHFNSSASKIVEDFSKMMDSALGAFVIANNVSEQVHKNIQNKLEEVMKKKDIEFSDDNLPLVLNGLVKKAQKKLQDVIKLNVENWEPESSNFMPKIDYDNIIDPIQKAINRMLNNLGAQIASRVNGLMGGVIPADEKKSKSRVFLHGTSSDNWKDIQNEGFKRLPNDDTRRMYPDNLLGNNGIYLSDDIKSQWFMGDNARMPVYDKIIGLAADFKKTMKVKNDEQLMKLFDKYGLDKNNVPVNMEKLVDNLRKDGYDAFEVDYPKEVEALKEKMYKDKDAMDKLIKQGYSQVADLGRQIFALDPKSLKPIGEVDRNKGNKEIFSSLQSTLGENEPYKINTKDLHKDVRKYLADDADMTVKEWAKMVPALQGDEGLSKVMSANIAVIMEKFHDTISRHTKAAVDLYKNELSAINPVPNTESVNYLALQLERIQDQIAKKIKQAINAQVEAMFEALKGIKVDGRSIGFDDLAAFARMAGNNKTSTSSNDNRSVGADKEKEDTRVGHPLPANKVISGDFSNYGSFTDEDNAYTRSGRIKAAGMVNRYRDKISGELMGTIDDFIQNHYLRGVDEIAYQSKGEEKNLAKQRLDQEFSMFEQMIKALQHDNRLDENIDYQRLKQRMFEGTFDVNSRKLANDFEWKLGTDDFDSLNNRLNELKANARQIAEMPLFNDEDFRNYREQVSALNKELTNLRTQYAPLAQDVSKEAQMERLRFEADRLRSSGVVPSSDIDRFSDAINNVGNQEQLERVRLMLRYLQDLQRVMNKQNSQALQAESRQIQVDGLRLDADILERNGVLPVQEIDRFRESLDNIISPQDVQRARLMLRYLKDMQKAMSQEQKEDAKRGTLIAQNQLLAGNNALQAEHLQAVLRQIPALERYTTEQVKVNTATNTWSAKLVDAHGNIQTLQGSIDRATGELYQHAQALQQVISQTSKLNGMGSPKFNYGGGGGGGILGNYYQRPDYDGQNKSYNPNGTFTSSVVNTMRYITAGALIGAPSMAFYRAWDSAKTFDYEMEKARQNFIIKGDDPSEEARMRDVAEERVRKTQPGLSGTAFDEAVVAEQQSLRGMAGDIGRGQSARSDVQDIALRYAIPTEEAAKAFHIGSRSVDDPNEALAITQAVSKAKLIEETDTEVAAKGLESIMNQYGVSGYDTMDIMDMMIMGANLSPATLQDLLQTQQRSGSIFSTNLPGMTKRDQLGTSIGLSAMFAQSTARSGAEGGTFFKAILQRPFTGKGQKALEALSQQKGFEELNPYTTDQFGNKTQKNFVDIFGTIMEKSMTLDDASKKQLWSTIFPQWHQGSASAIEAFMKNMTKELTDNEKFRQIQSDKSTDRDGDGQVSIKEAFADYFDKIQNVDKGQIDVMEQGMKGTWQKRTQMVSTMWSASTEGVFNELKDEFSEVASYLTVFMRMIRDNADGVANALTLASKAAVGLGLRFAFKKVNEGVKNAERGEQEKRFGRMDRYLGLEQQHIAMRRQAVQAKLANRPDIRAAERRAVMTTQLTNATGQRDALRQSMVHNQALSRAAAQNGDIAEVERLRVEMTRLRSEFNTVNTEATRLQNSLNELDAEEREVTQETQRLQAELADTDREMRSVNGRIEALGLAMQDAGLDSQKLKTKVQQLNTQFQSGKIDAQTYEASIAGLAHEAGASDQQIERLRQEVNRLNKEFSEGKLNAQQYASQLDELNRAQITGALGIPGGGIGGNPAMQSGAGLSSGIVGASLFGGAMVSRGLLSRVKDAVQTRSLGALVGRGPVMRDNTYRAEILRDRNNNPIYEADVIRENAQRTAVAPGAIAGAAGGMASGLGSKLKVLGKGVGKMIPGLGTALALFEGANWAMDATAASGMTVGEKAEHQAKNLNDIYVQSQNVDKGGIFSKILGGFSMGSSMLFQGANNLAGGNGVSYQDSLKVITAMLRKDGEDLNSELKKILGDTNAKMAEADRLRNEELEKQMYQDPSEDSALDELANTADQELTALDELNDAVSKIDSTLERNLGLNQAQMTIDQSKLLLSGVAEDSQQMRDLMDEYLRKNIQFIDAAIVELQAKKDDFADKDSEEYKELEAREKQLQAEKASNQLQIRQNQMSEYDAIMGKLADELKATETEYGIQKADAQIGGADTDSAIVKKIDSAQANKSNALIENTQRELQQLIRDTNAQGAERSKIERTIMELEKDQRDNLVQIKEKMDKEKATFNLPSGVKPVSYVDYVSRNSTHSNVTTRMGDVVVNLTIGNMNGNASEAQRLGDTLTDAIRQANQKMANTFNSQVIAGMGSNYFRR
jgi:hypothetical protein